MTAEPEDRVRQRQAQEGLDQAELNEREEAEDLVRTIEAVLDADLAQPFDQDADERAAICLACDAQEGEGCLMPRARAVGVCPRQHDGPESLSAMAAAAVAEDWGDMGCVPDDGRHVILRFDPKKDWSRWQRIPRWRGGVVAQWCDDEDHWKVHTQLKDMGSGVVHFFDSRWFRGWKPLPSISFEDENPAFKVVAPPAPEE